MLGIRRGQLSENSINQTGFLFDFPRRLSYDVPASVGLIAKMIASQSSSLSLAQAYGSDNALVSIVCIVFTPNATLFSQQCSLCDFHHCVNTNRHPTETYITIYTHEHMNTHAHAHAIAIPSTSVRPMVSREKRSSIKSIQYISSSCSCITTIDKWPVFTISGVWPLSDWSTLASTRLRDWRRWRAWRDYGSTRTRFQRLKVWRT